MLDLIRATWERHPKLTESELARRASVSRSQLRTFLKGENVTLETARRVTAALGLELTVRPIDGGDEEGRRLVEARRAAASVYHDARTLVDALEAHAEVAALTRQPPAGATRDEGGTEVTPELLAKLDRLLAEIKAGYKPKSAS